jgi:DNA topoisomerase I
LRGITVSSGGGSGEQLAKRDCREETGIARGTRVAFEAWLESRGEIGLKPAVQLVADSLGNTPAISRKSYVHPAVLEVLKEKDSTALPQRLPRATRWLSREERGLIEFLRADPAA